MVIPAQQSSLSTIPPIPVMKGTLSPSTMSYLPFPSHSQTQFSNHQRRHECSYMQKINNIFFLQNSPNRNEEDLADFSFKNRLACLNTKVQKMEGKL